MNVHTWSFKQWISILVATGALAGCKPGSTQYVVPFPLPSSSSVSGVTVTDTSCEPYNPIDPSPTPTPSPTPGPGNGGIIGLAIGQRTATPAPLCRPNQAVLSFEGSISEFGIQSVNSHPYRTLTVVNIGKSDATQVHVDAIDAPFAFRGGVYPGLGGTCGTTVVARASCAVVVAYNPIAIVQSLSALRIHYFDTVAQQLLSTDLTGMGAAYPTLIFAEDSPYDLGSHTIGTSSQHVFTVIYAGMHPATGLTTAALGSGFSFTGGAYPGNGGTCGTEISSDCTVAVTFAPASVGAVSQSLVLNYNNGAFAAAASIQVTGTGTQVPTQPRLQITAVQGNGTNFGNRLVGSSTTLQFKVQNLGTLPALALAPVAFTSGQYGYEGGSYPGNSGNCSGSVTSDCLIAITFAPDHTGSFPDSLKLGYADAQSGAHQASLAISGTGVVAPLLQISGADPIDFGTRAIGFSATQTIILSNSSSVLPITGISLSGFAVPFSQVSTTCGASLAASSSCQLVVAFRPTDGGAVDNWLSAAYFDGFNSRMVTKHLIGNGNDAAYLVFDPATRNFGSIILGSTSSLNFTVHYYGRKPASNIDWQNLAGPDFF